VPRRIVNVNVLGAVAGAVAIAVGGYLVGIRSSNDTCRDGEVRVDGDCASIRPGKPVDPDTGPVEHISSVLIDEDPAAGSLGGRCGFQGVAGGRADVYICLMIYNKAPITFRLVHDRDGRVYRWTLLRNPQPNFFFKAREGTSGACTYRDQSPDCV
jgi:hypothetical protein